MYRHNGFVRLIFDSYARIPSVVFRYHYLPHQQQQQLQLQPIRRLRRHPQLLLNPHRLITAADCADHHLHLLLHSAFYVSC